ncbi:MAG: sigma-70 family RNA polymerase sigma factor [Clostridia bacterium]|nr:sigma-70 family RNA polymerase sigma factor [Clostridia bacterium]
MTSAEDKVFYNGLSDDELISLVREGDGKAVDALLLKYKGTVSYLADKFFSNSLTFDDWFQEGMIGLLLAIRTYNPDGGASFATYSSVCIKNRLSVCLKKATNLKNLPLNTAVPYEDVQDLTVDSSEDNYIASESYRYFESTLLQQLSGTEQNVMQLYISGFSYAEIAQQLKISVKSVDNAVCRAKNKLKKALKN